MQHLLNQLKTKPKGQAQLQLYHQVGQHLFTKSKRNFWTEKQLFQHLKNYPKVALLKRCYRFFACFPNLNWNHQNLTWTHYILLQKIKTEQIRQYYFQKAIEEHWTTTELKRQIQSDYAGRLTQQSSQPKTLENQSILKKPFQFEFVQMQNQSPISEWQLETALMNQMPKLLLELGNGFAFVARQKLIAANPNTKFYIDLVFYHYLQKCFILIDLKATPLDHRALGQMDMYLRLFDHYWRTDADQPTKGIILCPEINPIFENFSLLKNNSNLFATQYTLG